MIVRQSYEHNGEKFSIQHSFNEEGKCIAVKEIKYGTPKQPGELIMPRVGLNDEYYEYIKDSPLLRNKNEKSL